MKIRKNYIVQVKRLDGWVQSLNEGADGKYTKESAARRAKYQAKGAGMEYRIKEVK